MKTLATVVLLSLTLLIGGVSGICQVPPPMTKVIEAVGTGSIFEGDVAGARDRAIDDALRQAVEQALGTFIESETKVQNYQVVDDNILSWTRGYVQNYTILSDYKKTPELYEVRLKAEVALGELQRDAEAVKNLIERMGNPRVMVIIDEQNIGDPTGHFRWFDVNMTAAETAIMQKFVDSDFPVVDPGTVRENIKREQVMAALQGDDKAAAAIGLSFGAEIVITGKAVATVASGFNMAGMKSCQANITARVVEADVGRVLATASEHAAYPHIDEVTGGTMAIQKAANKFAEGLIAKILAKWRDKYYNVGEVKIVLRGLESMAQLSDFVTTAKFYLRGVKNIYQRNYGGGSAELDVKISGNATQLAREFERRDFGRFTITVESVSANRITARFVPKVQPVAEPE
ncbi:MAG: flagellar assembly protein T N-terminal domain-containing protein [bacterium]|nr:flagellar assembly protein T N-terminal domain-containing protein [candidate division KSB1 bacterium]MDH7560060.1 flagellar assembly protein T N-terminal domain-containing protein [bacterium]